MRREIINNYWTGLPNMWNSRLDRFNYQFMFLIVISSEKVNSVIHQRLKKLMTMNPGLSAWISGIQLNVGLDHGKEGSHVFFR